MLRFTWSASLWCRSVAAMRASSTSTTGSTVALHDSVCLLRAALLSRSPRLHGGRSTAEVECQGPGSLADAHSPAGALAWQPKPHQSSLQAAVNQCHPDTQLYSLSSMGHLPDMQLCAAAACCTVFGPF